MLRDTDKDVITITPLEKGGFGVNCKTESGGEWQANYYGMVSYDNLRNLEGKVLTIIDASFQDKEQRKAVKDVFRRTFWFDWIENCIYKGKGFLPVSMPSLNENIVGS